MQEIYGLDQATNLACTLDCIPGFALLCPSSCKSIYSCTCLPQLNETGGACIYSVMTRSHPGTTAGLLHAVFVPAGRCSCCSGPQLYVPVLDLLGSKGADSALLSALACVGWPPGPFTERTRPRTNNYIDEGRQQNEPGTQIWEPNRPRTAVHPKLARYRPCVSALFPYLDGAHTR